MSIQLLDTLLDAPLWDQSFVFEGKLYNFTFDYVERSGSYVLHLLDADGVTILAGIRLTCNTLLLARFHHLDGVPPGDLIAVSHGNDESPAKLGELGIGRRVELHYYSADELA